MAGKEIVEILCVQTGLNTISINPIYSWIAIVEKCKFVCTRHAPCAMHSPSSFAVTPSAHRMPQRSGWLICDSETYSTAVAENRKSLFTFNTHYIRIRNIRFAFQGNHSSCSALGTAYALENRSNVWCLKFAIEEKRKRRRNQKSTNVWHGKAGWNLAIINWTSAKFRWRRISLHVQRKREN